MDKVIPMSWLNQILLVFSTAAAVLSLVVQAWTGLSCIPIYVSISWAVFITIISIWLSCYLLHHTLKTNSPIHLESCIVTRWIYKYILVSHLELDISVDKNRNKKVDRKSDNEQQENLSSAQESSIKSDNNAILEDSHKNEVPLTRRKRPNVIDMTQEINAKCIEIWYKNISNDKSFPDEAQHLLSKFLTRLAWKFSLIDKVKLTNKLVNVLLLHLKEYRRALRRVEKGAATSIEEAYKYSHPGSRNTSALEHMLHRLVTVLAQEFLQWELTSSLPCKLLLSILAKRLLITIETINCPNWLTENLLKLLEVPSEETVITPAKQNGTITVALSDGITSATAAVIPQQLPTSLPKSNPSTTVNGDEIAASSTAPERPTLCLGGLSTEHRGLWGGSITEETDLELEEDKISPVYEEPTDFATTIARLRSLLQQKSTATTPLHTEEKSYVIYEGSQFTNLMIPWTEFHTAADGSQQLFYCIQFDDVEQRGVDLFETTTATVRRQYSDFVQLHLSLEEFPSLAGIMSELVLPEGGRIELETYLKMLCTRLANECPPQLRHFLRPSSGAGKKADAVAPRFDRFLAKTVTGVLNTLKKTVVPFELDPEEEAPSLPTLMPLSDIPWRFVEDIKSKSLACELQQLIAERTEYCTVDTAYEAVDSMEASGDSESLDRWWETVNTSYDDEADELDSNLTLTCTMLDVVCELLAGTASNNTLQQEVVIRWTKLLIGNISEPIMQNTILWLFNSLGNSSLVYNTPLNVTKQPDAQLKDKLLHVLNGKLSYSMKLIFGEDDIHKALNYLLSSYEIKKINMDVNMQMLDTLVSELLVSCKTNHDITH